MIVSYLKGVQYVVLGQASFTLRCNFRKGNKVTVQTKLSECFLICLPSKASFEVSGCQRRRETQVKANVGEICSVIFVCFMAT